MDVSSSFVELDTSFRALLIDFAQALDSRFRSKSVAIAKTFLQLLYCVAMLRVLHHRATLTLLG